MLQGDGRIFCDLDEIPALTVVAIERGPSGLPGCGWPRYAQLK